MILRRFPLGVRSAFSRSRRIRNSRTEAESEPNALHLSAEARHHGTSTPLTAHHRPSAARDSWAA